MVWWGWGGGELKCIAKGRCTAVAGGVKCEVREAMILRIAFHRGRQGKPKSPGDFVIYNVGVRRGECRDEEEGPGLEWPVREQLRWPVVAAQGVAASGIVHFVVLGIGSVSCSPSLLCQL